MTADDWTRRAVINVASVGRFSSDRTLHAYAKDIWNVSPIRLSARRARR